MIEGNGYDSAEAGPSRPRPIPIRQTHRSPSPLAKSHSPWSDDSLDVGSVEVDDPEEVLRENEVTELEDDLLLPRKDTTTCPIDNKYSTIRPNLPPRRSTNTIKGKSLPPNIDLSTILHTSSSEIFDIPTSTTCELATAERSRPTTYSSLPPSPREKYLSLEDDGEGKIPMPKGLGINDLDKVLQKLNGTNHPDVIHHQRHEEEDTEDEFWPAQSRGGTNTYPSPNPNGDTTLNSPTLENNFDQDGKLNVNREGDKELDSFSIWDLLKDDMGSEGWDGWIADGKWERIANFLAVPLAVEKTTLFGALLCLDGFLYNFTILPIRAIFALINLFSSRSSSRSSEGGWWFSRMPLAHQHSLLRMLLLFIPTVVLLAGTDASKMYHSVRGQDTIKLYVIFNALEIADRLCGAFGQDVLDTLFARETLSPPLTSKKVGKGRRRQQARPVFFFALSLGYVLAHTLIFFYMLVSLNVAINSYDYTLLSLLISNQFVEIKGSVFKKFEKENLFQIMCADIVERFQLSLMLAVIAIRNMIEMAGSEIAFLPRSFIRGKSLVDAILSPILFVIVSEMVVDWLKHAFITKFNHVRASVYERFTDVLAKDVLLAGSGRRLRGRRNQILLDQSPLVARRLGFASIPLACLVIRIGAQAIGMLASSHQNQTQEPNTNDGDDAEWLNVAWITLKWGSWLGVGGCAWACLIFLKVLLGLSLLSFSATRQEGMDAREAEDSVNDFGRSAVGESKEETEYHKTTTAYLSHSNDDMKEYPSPAAAHTPQTPYGLPKSALLNNAQYNNNDSYDLNSPLENNDNGHTKKDIGKNDSVNVNVKAAKGKGKKWKLEEVERWTMVKRIW